MDEKSDFTYDDFMKEQNNREVMSEEDLSKFSPEEQEIAKGLKHRIRDLSEFCTSNEIAITLVAAMKMGDKVASAEVLSLPASPRIAVAVIDLVYGVLDRIELESPELITLAKMLRRMRGGSDNEE